MGYDMKMLDGTKYLVEDWQRLRAGDPALPADLCDLARSLGDTKPYRDFDDTKYSAPRSFRVNCGGMGLLYATMRDHGMLDTSGECPEPPAPEGNGWGDTYRRLATYRHGASVGISWWKLSSNDYWIVTADECRDALRAWHVNAGSVGGASEGERELWCRWLGYLVVGAATDGFEVG